MLTSLRLVNFKCFHDQRLKLGPLTLLSGANGSGKSTVLQALLLLRQSLSTSNGGMIHLNGDLVRIGRTRDLRFEGAEDETITIEIDFIDRGEQCRASWTLLGQSDDSLLAIIEGQNNHQRLPLGLVDSAFHYVKAERLGPRNSFELSDHSVRIKRQFGTAGEFAAHFLDVYGDESICDGRLSHPAEKSLKIIRQVEAWMSEICSGIRINLDRQFLMDLITIHYSFESGQYISNDYRATNVGFGVTYTFPILVSVLSAKPGTLLLLENPEAHLHPRGQTQLGALFAQAATCGIQIIAETHSDHLLNGIRVAVLRGFLEAESVCIHFLERRGYDGPASSDVLSPRIDQKGRLDYWPKGFFDEWEESLAMLLDDEEG